MLNPLPDLYVEEVLRRNVFGVYLDQSPGPFAGIFGNKGFVDDQAIDQRKRGSGRMKMFFAVGFGTGEQDAVDHGLVVPVGQSADYDELSFLDAGAGCVSALPVFLSGLRRMASADITEATVLVVRWKLIRAFTVSFWPMWNEPPPLRRLLLYIQGNIDGAIPSEPVSTRDFFALVAGRTDHECIFLTRFHTQYKAAIGTRRDAFAGFP